VAMGIRKFLTQCLNNNICCHCFTKVIGDDGAIRHIRTPLPGGKSKPGQTAWYHNDCYNEYLHNLIIGYMHIDQCLNDCKYFVREDKSMYGWYERDGKRYPTKLWAGICYCDMINTKCLRTSYHAVIDDFRQWLENNEWWPDWWECFRPEIYKEDVRNNRRGEIS